MVGRDQVLLGGRERRATHALWPPPLAVLLTTQSSCSAGLAALGAGADGCVCKGELQSRLLPLLDDLLRRGGTFLSEPPSVDLRRLHRDLKKDS